MEIAIFALGALVCLANGHLMESTSHNQTASRVQPNVENIVRYLPRIIIITISVDVGLTLNSRISY